jgi:hypothetical protein
MVAAGGWWVAIVALLPASSRPFIDGSPDNNIFNLIFGYNGLSRIFGGGGPRGGAGGAGGGTNFSGPTGVLRLFDDLMGGQASWLLPAALVAIVVGLWLVRGTPRTDRRRAALIVWGGWLLVTAAIFSFSTGVIHTYYAVALAPAIAALVAIGAALLWERRDALWVRIVAAITVAGSGAWSYALLDRTPAWEPWLRSVVLVATIIGAAGLVMAPLLGRLARRTAILAGACVAVACFAGPLAYSAQTIATPQGGSLPSAGPTVAAGGGFGAPGGAGGFPGAGSRGLFGGGPNSDAAPGGGPGAGLPGTAPGGSQSVGGAIGSPGVGPIGRGLFGAAPGRGTQGGSSVSRALASTLETDAGSYRWVAATSGSMNAATIELATGGKPVMAIGGFNGNGGNLALGQFERDVRAGQIHYYVSLGFGAGGGTGGAAASSSTAIATWVAEHFKSQTIGGATVYTL